MDNTKKIIEFFELREGWSKEEIIADIVDDIEMTKGKFLDELGVLYDEDEILGTLDVFVSELFEKFTEKFCAVVKSFQEEKVSDFEVMDIMSKRDKDIKFVSLANSPKAEYGTKKGGSITLGGLDLKTIMNINKYMGGLYLVNKEQFMVIQKRLKKERV